jgi:hypothetical protein
MSREGECSLARAHGEFDASKDTMDVSARPSLEAKMACVRNLKELLNLELKVANVDILPLNEKKMTAQANLIAVQSEVIVAECMLEKTNRKFFDLSGVLISSHNFSFFIPCFIFWITIKVHICCLSGDRLH